MNESLLTSKIKKLFASYPQIKMWFQGLSLHVISEEMTLEELLKSLSLPWFRDSGLTQKELLTGIENIIAESSGPEVKLPQFTSLTVLGGKDKNGKKEDFTLELKSGDVFGITGPTGSGKTRLLEDIEYLAEGDSPSGRRILINGKNPSEEERSFYEHKLTASLSQNMNFVMELSVADFIKLHAECRKKELSQESLDALVKEVLVCANNLAGEKINQNSIITQLSGGQSRALMIADIALVSDAQIVLIDEPENAGIDKDDILTLLSSRGKIVLVSTHDPVIALSCPRRIVIKNGAVASILNQTPEEKVLLSELKSFDLKIKTIRNCIREGKHVS